ncbi:hypothetical protein [Dyadobacter fanqingshengii]|uniref:Uncharacterized protein n=1 Tax=Dyadobacter fanqingshengii TaxID=2906443 RepID=A0A9X1T8Q5_9BACT|nr:hypothetical protein [Dyadobacter fanqingshengii]MCF0039768.1 hypothetical protein [Dyadobacter fanqingshengii]USJ38469.1 hypothetical protein NFI81_11940 [Dyadobacter fanqingshengii]
MNIIYSRLFEVSVLHDYFREGIAKGLKLIPTRETQETLRKGRMLWKETSQGVIVLYHAEGDRTSPEVALVPPVDFYFFFQSTNSPQFLAVTELRKGDRIYGSGDFLAFQNSPAGASIDQDTPEKIELDIWDGTRQKTFITRLNLDPAPAKVIFQVKDALGTKIPSGRDKNGDLLPLDLELASDDRGEFFISLDLKGKQEGNYTLILRNEADTADLWTKEYFLTQDPEVKSALGVMKISYRPDPDHLYGGREYYAIDLKRKATKWTYIIVSQNKKVDLGTAGLSILDKGNPQDSPYATYDFERMGAAPNADVKVNNSETVIFKSQVPIPFFEIPKLNLELRRKPGNRVLLSHLPNPSRSGAIKTSPGEEISEIYVFI